MSWSMMLEEKPIIFSFSLCKVIALKQLSCEKPIKCYAAKNAEKSLQRCVRLFIISY